MKTFDVQATEIHASSHDTFDYLAAPHNLPAWANAFKEVANGRAVMHTPTGSVEVALVVQAAREHGTVDWIMTFPDGSMATAYSRVVPAGPDRSIYSFILMAPPVPLEQLEGTLAQQSHILREELARLRAILEHKQG